LADLDDVVRLWKEMMAFHANLDSYFVMAPGAEDSYREYASGNIQDEERLFLVCCASDQVIGYLHAEVQAYPPIYPETRYGEIMEIAVAESERRRGGGRLLLQAALAWIQEQGIKRVECRVGLHNPVSQAFWKGQGFKGYLESCVFEL
jgi:ribosomal protein S18 acetylase RimI-like enzyme